MRKTYHTPKTGAIYIAPATITVTSDPAVTIDDDETVEAGGVEVKKGNNYDVWEEDWNE